MLAAPHTVGGRTFQLGRSVMADFFREPSERGRQDGKTKALCQPIWVVILGAGGVRLKTFSDHCIYV